VLPGLVTGQPTILNDGLRVTLAPGSTMPPILIAGNGPKALRRAAVHGDGWAAIGISPAEVAAHLATLEQLAEQHGRPRPGATVVGPPVSTDPTKAASQLADYADAGTERVVLAPTGSDWRHDYEFAYPYLIGAVPPVRAV
jgi:alkanesulfonate monooxygenase SsuD/methylene tetrahydromethanopterin reductase-like flavin-dependent oxidoreductase (luciferase family)